MRPAKRRQFRGFTLVELLVVMVILSLLAALAAAAVFTAVKMAKEARIKTEMAQMAQQFEMMKIKFDEYPPSTKDDADDYVRKISSRVSTVQADLDAEVAGFDPDTPERALVFWLKGISRDPTNPITGAATRDYKFEFEIARLSGDQITLDGLYFPPIETAAQAYRYESAGGQSFTIRSAGVDDTWNTEDDLSVPE